MPHAQMRARPPPCSQSSQHRKGRLLEKGATRHATCHAQRASGCHRYPIFSVCSRTTTLDVCCTTTTPFPYLQRAAVRSLCARHLKMRCKLPYPGMYTVKQGHGLCAGAQPTFTQCAAATGCAHWLSVIGGTQDARGSHFTCSNEPGYA